MSKKTIYTCERCKRELTDSEIKENQLWSVGIHLQNAFPRSYSYGQEVVPSCSYPMSESGISLAQEWCRECIEDVGLLGSKYAPQTKPVLPGAQQQAAPTLEDLIRGFVDDAVSDAVRNQ